MNSSKDPLKIRKLEIYNSIDINDYLPEEPVIEQMKLRVGGGDKKGRRYCACGCGNKPRTYSPRPRFVAGHYPKFKWKIAKELLKKELESAKK